MFTAHLRDRDFSHYRFRIYDGNYVFKSSGRNKFSLREKTFDARRFILACVFLSRLLLIFIEANFSA